MNPQQEADQIQAEMARLRRGLNDGVDGFVENAKTLTDYRYYVKRHPWACLGVAAAVGFLAVPSRAQIVQPSLETMENLARRHKLLVQVDPQAQKRGGSTLGTLARMAAGTMLRLGVTYAGQQASKVMSDAAAAIVTAQANEAVDKVTP